MLYKDYLKLYLENNQEKILYIIRGSPGTGKSYLADSLVGNGKIFELDQLMTKDGVYKFDDTDFMGKLNQLKANIKFAIESGVSPIIISNVASRFNPESINHVRLVLDYNRRHENSPYVIKVIEADEDWIKKNSFKDENGKWNFDKLKGKNVHNVPDDALYKIINRWEYHDVFMKNLNNFIQAEKFKNA